MSQGSSKDEPCGACKLNEKGRRIMNLLLCCVTLLVAGIASYIAVKCNLPMGLFLGALFGVALLNLLYGDSYFYSELTLVMKILSGCMIGAQLGREQLSSMKALAKPTVILLVGLISMNLIFGGLVYQFSVLDLPTSLYAVTPGGLSDIVLMSGDLGADPTYVGLLQVFRQVVIFLILVPISHKVLRHQQRKQSGQAPMATTILEPSVLPPFCWRVFCELVGCGMVIGLLFDHLGLAGGALTGAMVGSGAYSVVTQPSVYPKPCKNVLRILSGAYVGSGLTRESLSHLHTLLIPVLIMLVGIVGCTLCIAFVMHKVCKLDLAVCLLASTPGGLQEMTLLADDFGASAPPIAVMHTVRLITIISLFPFMLDWVCQLWG